MRTLIHPQGFTVWLSARDTYDWAHKPGASWPCSTLSDKRLVAVFDSNGLCDLAVDGRDAAYDIVAHEVSAMIADHMRDKLPADHACYFVAVGQFARSARTGRTMAVLRRARY